MSSVGVCGLSLCLLSVSASAVCICYLWLLSWAVLSLCTYIADGRSLTYLTSPRMIPGLVWLLLLTEVGLVAAHGLLDAGLEEDHSTPFWGTHTVYGNYSGDILLGALFPVHQMGPSDGECGRIQASTSVSSPVQNTGR